MLGAAYRLWVSRAACIGGPPSPRLGTTFVPAVVPLRLIDNIDIDIDIDNIIDIIDIIDDIIDIDIDIDVVGVAGGLV